MDFFCHKRGCTARDHLNEYEFCMANFGVDKVRKALVDFTAEQMALLQKISLNWINTKNPIYMFLSGSLLVYCLWEEPMCKALEGVRLAGAAERSGAAYYLPHTLFSEEVLENLPLPEVSEEEYEIKKYYVVSLQGFSGEGDALEDLARFFESAPVFLGKRAARVVRGVPYMPQLANKYTDKIDILLKGVDGSLTGLGYVDVTKTYHLGFSKAKSFLLYGLDRVVLLHPHVDLSFHREVANRIKNRWDISEVGYAVLNPVEEELYFYKLPRKNRYLSMSVSAQKHSSVIRRYIESL
ncbi:hypothetical protein [Pyrobaculum aerophilum]|uniref:Uncharacterized protein n=1 Tax=Pyrobaculum aerophilum TaxID=13773 RepID=A0A371R5W6_9CREN|nr:hypothetical protein [Pyrobaculum aerophilum]RFA92808.1 hypothetical protein CGL51_13940 [Pyrobaculum aerophilum]RFA99475.1 hypothetical protein CGL52_02730 [Pyrobaculum aerophilum]